MARVPGYGISARNKPVKPKAAKPATRKPKDRDDYSSGYKFTGGVASRPAAPRSSKRCFAG